MTQRYNTGNPRPSNSMKDLNDNALANDDYMNSEADTFIDRLGDERDTLRGSTKKMLAAGAAVVEETRQNLIPLSKQYMTLAAAQADIANIPEGSTTYYRSPDDSALAIEVMNVGGTLQPTGRRMLRDDYGYQVSPDCVSLAGYDPETKRVAPFLNTEGRLIQIGPDGKYYEVLTPPEAELYALGSDGQVTQFIGGEKVWRMIVDATTNQIVEAYTVGGHHWIYSDSGLVLVNQESGGGGGCSATASDTVSVSGGGASGSYFRGKYNIASVSPSVAITIGAGGLGGNGAAGGSGGDTKFGSLATAPGGLGGTSTTRTASSAFFAVGGNPGEDPTGNNLIATKGSRGGAGMYLNSSSVSVGGDGASSQLGGGGIGSGNSGTTGTGGSGFGAGGGGNARQPSSSAINGYPGASGVIIISEYA